MYHYKHVIFTFYSYSYVQLDTEIYGTASLHLYAVGGRCSVPLSVQTSHYLIRQTTIGLLLIVDTVIRQGENPRQRLGLQLPTKTREYT